jgi:hypothetical protein
VSAAAIAAVVLTDGSADGIGSDAEAAALG